MVTNEDLRTALDSLIRSHHQVSNPTVNFDDCKAPSCSSVRRLLTQVVSANTHTIALSKIAAWSSLYKSTSEEQLRIALELIHKESMDMVPDAMQPAKVSGLAEAWKEAEEILPNGWAGPVLRLSSLIVGRYQAQAFDENHADIWAYGTTPEEALRDLTQYVRGVRKP